MYHGPFFLPRAGPREAVTLPGVRNEQEVPLLPLHCGAGTNVGRDGTSGLYGLLPGSPLLGKGCNPLYSCSTESCPGAAEA